MTTAKWIDELPTVQECDKEIARLSHWLDTKREEMSPRDSVALADRIRNWEKKRIWARRYGKE
jgi:hypothetical protein